MIKFPEFLHVILVQSLGSISALLYTVIIVKKFGVQVQGDFAISKSVIDILSIIGQLGFLQAYVMLKENKGVLEGGLFKITNSYVFFITFALLFVWLISPWIISESRYVGFCIILAALLTIYGSLLRAISLATRSSKIFSVVTICYPVTVLLGFALLPSSYESSLTGPLAFFVLISVIASFFVIKLNYNLIGSKFSWGDVFEFSIWIFIPNVIQVLIPLFMYRHIESSHLGVYSVGELSISMMLAGIFLFPINYYYPIIYKNLIKFHDQFDVGRRLLLVVICCFFYFLFTAVAFIFGWDWVVLNLIPVQNELNIEIMIWVCATTIIAAISRILISVLQSMQFEKEAALISFVKVILFILILQYSIKLIDVVCAWFYSELISIIIEVAMVMYLFGKRNLMIKFLIHKE